MASDKPTVLVMPTGRIAISDINHERGVPWNRRTGLAEAGTWFGLGAGTRHGMNFYHGKDFIQHVDNLTVTGNGYSFSSSHPHIFPNISYNSGAGHIGGLKGMGYLRSPVSGGTWGNGTYVNITVEATSGRYNIYRLYIGGAYVMEWRGGNQTTSASFTFQIFN